LSGSYEIGDYMYLFQVKSASKNLNIVITNLAGFVSSNVNNYGQRGFEGKTLIDQSFHDARTNRVVSNSSPSGLA